MLFFLIKWHVKIILVRPQYDHQIIFELALHANIKQQQTQIETHLQPHRQSLKMHPLKTDHPFHMRDLIKRPKNKFHNNKWSQNLQIFVWMSVHVHVSRVYVCYLDIDQTKTSNKELCRWHATNRIKQCSHGSLPLWCTVLRNTLSQEVPKSIAKCHFDSELF